MNQRKAKALRRKSYALAAEHLKTLLPEDEQEQVTSDSVREFEKSQDQTIFDGEKITLAPYSSKWFYRKLKQGKADFRIEEKELGIDDGKSQVRL